MAFKKLTELKQVEALIAYHNTSKQLWPIAIDLETTGLNPRQDTIVSIVMTGRDEDEVVTFSPAFINALRSVAFPTLFQNFSFDFSFLKQQDIPVESWDVTDTMLLDHLRDENDEHSLDAIVKRYFNDDYKEVFWSKYKKIEEAPESDRIEYECKDVYYTRQAYKVILADVLAQDIPQSLIKHVHKLAFYLWKTEYRGLNVDLEYLTKLGRTLKSEIEILKPKMRAACETECSDWEFDTWIQEIDKRKTPLGKQRVPKPTFSFDSSTQLKDLLYTRLKLPIQYNDKTRKPSTDYDALMNIKDKHPVVEPLLEYRDKNKVYSTYVEGILTRMEGGRIYPRFNVNGTTTGRISHANPNMGNMPSSGGIRAIFKPDDGMVMIGADYGMLEVVIAAHYSNDANLLKIIYDGASQHDITAEALGIPRAQAKTLNFAAQYGCTEHRVKAMLKCSEQEAKNILRKYWEAYSGQKKVIDECHRRVDAGLPIINLFGRRRHFPTQFNHPGEKGKAYRQSYSALIQGSGGDLTSRALYVVGEKLERLNWGSVLFSVHDEVLIQAYPQYAEEAEALLVETMQNEAKLAGITLPLKAEGSGPMTSWRD